MSAAGYAIPAPDPRAIFAAAEDFMITQALLGRATSEHDDCAALRVLGGPATVLSAFACELYFKCLNVDAGAKTVPGRHNLTVLYMNLSPSLRERLRYAWRETVKGVTRMQEVLEGSRELEDIISAHADSFDHWRYRFEKKQGRKLVFDPAAITMLAVFLRAFILARHPDWDDGWEHFQSTFPVP